MAVQSGYLLIADITGYTQYLTESELDHAEKILTSLLNVLIQKTKPPLVISRLAGDAVISYAVQERFVAPQTFAEMIEDTYVAFRRQIELMVRNTTCTCNACRNIPSLDLKFFVHFGQFGLQKLDAHDELVGSDVNLLHRLLKNHVTEATGLRAYTLFTEGAVKALGLDAEALSLIRREESYEHLGTVHVYIEDMHPIWDARERQTQVRIAPDDAMLRFETTINAPPEIVWNNIVQPEHFNVLLGGDRGTVSGKKRGRVTHGSAYNCYHGDGVIVNTVVGWRPFEFLTLEFVLHVPLADVTALAEVQLDAVPGGSHVIEIFSHTRGPLVARMAADAGLKSREALFRDLLAGFKTHVEDEARLLAAMAPAPAIGESQIQSAARASLSSEPA